MERSFINLFSSDRVDFSLSMCAKVHSPEDAASLTHDDGYFRSCLRLVFYAISRLMKSLTTGLSVMYGICSRRIDTLCKSLRMHTGESATTRDQSIGLEEGLRRQRGREGRKVRKREAISALLDEWMVIANFASLLVDRFSCVFHVGQRIKAASQSAIKLAGARPIIQRAIFGTECIDPTY